MGLFGAALGLVGGGLAEWLGGEDEERRQNRQDAFFQGGLDAADAGQDYLREGYGEASAFADRAIEIAMGVTDRLLGQTDPLMSAQVRRIRLERKEQEALMQQQLAARGLDNFTTRTGAMQSVRGAGSNAYNDLTSRVASLRQSAVGQGTGMQLNALNQRGLLAANRGSALADFERMRAQGYWNQQVAPSQTAEGVGNWTSLVLEGALSSL